MRKDRIRDRALASTLQDFLKTLDTQEFFVPSLALQARRASCSSPSTKVVEEPVVEEPVVEEPVAEVAEEAPKPKPQKKARSLRKKKKSEQ